MNQPSVQVIEYNAMNARGLPILLGTHHCHSQFIFHFVFHSDSENIKTIQIKLYVHILPTMKFQINLSFIAELERIYIYFPYYNKTKKFNKFYFYLFALQSIQNLK